MPAAPGHGNTHTDGRHVPSLHSSAMDHRPWTERNFACVPC